MDSKAEAEFIQEGIKVDAMKSWADKAIQKITDEQSRKVALAR